MGVFYIVSDYVETYFTAAQAQFLPPYSPLLLQQLVCAVTHFVCTIYVSSKWIRNVPRFAQTWGKWRRVAAASVKAKQRTASLHPSNEKVLRCTICLLLLLLLLLLVDKQTKRSKKKVDRIKELVSIALAAALFPATSNSWSPSPSSRTRGSAITYNVAARCKWSWLLTAGGGDCRGKVSESWHSNLNFVFYSHSAPSQSENCDTSCRAVQCVLMHNFLGNDDGTDKRVDTNHPDESRRKKRRKVEINSYFSRPGYVVVVVVVAAAAAASAGSGWVKQQALILAPLTAARIGRRRRRV